MLKEKARRCFASPGFVFDLSFNFNGLAYFFVAVLNSVFVLTDLQFPVVPYLDLEYDDAFIVGLFL